MNNLDTSLLPGILRELCGLTGVGAVMKLVETYGGVRLYVPQKLNDDHALVKLIGGGNAQKLAEIYGGETLEIPKAEAAMRALRNREIRSLYPQFSQRELALKYNTTERNIRLILGDAQNDDQMTLF